MKTSQSARLIEYLRGGWRSTLQMIVNIGCTSPHRRISADEARVHLRKGEQIARKPHPTRRGSMLYRVTRTRP